MKTEPEFGYYIPRLTAAIDMLAIASLWSITLIVTNPFGNFPLNDDWSYGLVVKHLIENGDFRPTGWESIPLITHVIWGFLFSIPAGFSFDALRLSTLTLSLLGIFATYLLIRELRQPRWLAGLASLTLAFTPIYYALSHTFMTDVPYPPITIIASVFFVRNLRTGSGLAFLLGTVLAVAATLSRQLAISVPVAFAISFILKRGIGLRNIVRAAIPPALCIGALLAFQQWLAATDRLPVPYVLKNYQFFHALTKPGTILVFAKNAYVALLYLGWFLMPVLIFALASIWGSHRKKAIVFLIFSIGAMVIGAMLKGHPLMPTSRNIIVKSGIGPLTLRDSYILELNHVPALPAGFWLAITAISLLGAAFLITGIGLSAFNLVPKLWPARMNNTEVAATFLLLSGMIYLIPLLVSDSIFIYDRYFVPAVPFFAAGIAGVSSHVPRTNTKVCRLAAGALLFVFSLFAICGTRDYLAWNRIRWEALHDLMESRHAKVEDIDGGYEFNGWYLYDPQHPLILRRDTRNQRKSWWWVQGDTYQIGFGRIPGYTIIRQYNYRHWMPPHVGAVVVLKKNPPETPNTGGDEHAQHAPADADMPQR